MKKNGIEEEKRRRNHGINEERKTLHRKIIVDNCIINNLVRG
jgi:hypothetical protein